MLNISKYIYMGHDPNVAVTTLPLAEVIPIGYSSNEKQKLKKAANLHVTMTEHENVPMPGFTLLETRKTSWSSADSHWVVIDPRGYLVRITNKNLMGILLESGITEGLIQEKCVWARDNTETTMRLVPVSAADYVTAVKNTDLLENKVSIKDVQIGDRVLIHDGVTGVYLGTQTLYGETVTTYKTGALGPTVYPRRQLLKLDNGRYYYRSDLKILKILEKTKLPMTRNEITAQLNDEISNNLAEFTTAPGNHNSQYLLDTVKLVSATPADVEMSFEEISCDEATRIYNERWLSCNKELGVLLFVDDRDNMYVPKATWIFGSLNKEIEVNLTQLKSLDPVKQIEIIRTSAARYSSKKITKHIEEFKKYYKIIKTVKDKTFF